MISHYNVSYCKTTCKNWTPTAIDCYRLGCSCSKCHLYKIYFSGGRYRCNMKSTVFELIRKFGAPKEEEV